MIAITFALPTESSDLIRHVTKRTIVGRAGGRIVVGEIGNREVAIFHTGVGRKSCERAISGFVEAVHPDLLISSGFAGGVREDLKVGDLIVAENFSDPGLTTFVEGRTAVGPPTGSGELAPPTRVNLFTANSIIDSIEERQRLGREHGADAVDMETEVITRVCAGHGIRMLSLRVISDTADTPMPLPPPVLFDLERQRTNPGRLLSSLIKHPTAIGRLVRFARQIRRCRQILAEGLVDVVQSHL